MPPHLCTRRPSGRCTLYVSLTRLTDANSILLLPLIIRRESTAAAAAAAVAASRPTSSTA